MTITKNHLIESLTNICSTKKQAGKAIDSLIENIKSTLSSGEDILISGFGKFCIKNKKQRRGRNPSTGDEMLLDARKVVTFTCSERLKDKVNEKMPD